MAKAKILLNSSKVAILLAASLSLSACTTVSNWFGDEDEIEIRQLDPIEAKFEAKELWSEDLGKGVGAYFSRLQPAVGYELVFAADRQGRVAAFEPSTGKRVWRQDFATYSNDGYFSFISNLWSSGVSAKISGGLSLAYEAVYFGTENGDVYALDAKTGEQKWHAVVKGEVMAPPAIDENIVLVNTGSGVMFALDANDGKELWSYESDVPALSLRGISTPTAANGGAIVGTASGKLAVNILASGQSAWEQTISAPSGATELERIVDIDSKPLVVGGIIYIVSFDGSLAAVELRTGRVVWKREYKSYRSISAASGRLFVVDSNSNIFSLDIRNGVEQWSQGSLKLRSLTSATPIEDYIVVGDNFGFLHWLNTEDGEIVARLDLGGDDEDEAIYTAPIADGKVLYTLTREGELFAIEMP